MIEMIVVVGIVSLLAALIGAVIALKVQHTYLSRTQAQQQAWENAQQSHQRSWEIQQEKNVASFEDRLTAQVQEVKKAWEVWMARDRERIEALAKQHEESQAQLHVKHELARLPRIEDTPLSLNAKSLHQHHAYPDWRPPALRGANLSEHDFSHRFLGQADMRGSQLSKANFFMADLVDASLAHADLSDAELTGANLSGADLRGATMTGANLLVAELHGAILIGANLLGVRNLSIQQVCTAIYDSTTQFDAEIDIVRPRIRNAQQADISKPTSEPVTKEKPTYIMSTGTTEFSNESAFISAPETPFPSMLPDVEMLIQLQAESLLSSPLASVDSLIDPKVTDLLVDKQENTCTEAFDTAPPSQVYNSTKQVRAN